MSDLSWLNPTPHAIAVYASQPLSPVATQHSLPSGCYSLLGPDFHRLDRTSLRLAHLFDHLVGGDEQLVRHGEAEHLGGRGVDDELELCCPHYRQICGLRALEDAAGIAATLAIGIGQASSIAHQPAGYREWAEPIDHGDPVQHREQRQLDAPGGEEGIECDENGAGPLGLHGRERRVDLTDGAGL